MERRSDTAQLVLRRALRRGVRGCTGTDGSPAKPLIVVRWGEGVDGLHGFEPPVEWFSGWLGWGDAHGPAHRSMGEAAL